MTHFVRTFSIMRAYGVRLIAINEVQNYGKIVYIKNIFESDWWEDAKSPAYFSHLSLLILFFLLKGRVKRGGDHGLMPSPKYAPARQAMMMMNMTFALKIIRFQRNKYVEVVRYHHFFTLYTPKTFLSTYLILVCLMSTAGVPYLQLNT